MNFTFRNKSIAGALVVLPANERTFLEEMKDFNFPESRSLKLKEVMGYDKHRLVEPGVCVSDLAVFGLEHLFNKGMLERDGFDALVLVTQSPDHFLPATSNIIQGRLGLKRDLYCMDINQGCVGFVIGLLQGFMLLDHQEAIRRVVLINADVISRKVSTKDRNSYPLIGDAASITILERNKSTSKIFANLQMDGTRSGALMIPAGGFRMPSTPETAVLEDVGDNNFRAKDHLRMEGAEVFNFVMVEVPPMIENLLQFAGARREEIDYFLCHQPNRFMLQKLANKLNVPYAKMPSNVVEKFGNSSGVSIPVALVTNLAEIITSRAQRICFAGFGVGLTWASLLMDVGPLSFCQTVDYGG